MMNDINDPLFLEKVVHQAVLDKIKNGVKELLMEEIDRIIEETMIEIEKSLKVMLSKNNNHRTFYEETIIRTFYNGKELVEAS